jgi:hypothetical protein
MVDDDSFDDEFSTAALFPGMAAEHLLGVFTDSTLDLGASHAQTVAMLAALNAQADAYVDGDGCAWSVKAQADDATGQAVAWVEWRRRELGRQEDHNFYLKARDAEGRLRFWEIKTVNPYCGCTVESLAWDGDDVVLAYSDKHDRYAARLGRDNALSLQTVATPSSR